MSNAIYKYSLSGTATELEDALGLRHGFVRNAYRDGRDVRGLEVSRVYAKRDDDRELAERAVEAISDEARERLRRLLTRVDEEMRRLHA